MEQVDALKSLTGERSIRSLAIRLGMHQATLNRQAQGAGVPLEVLVQIAREYHLNLLDVLASLGYITREESAGYRTDPALRATPTIDLVGELYRRAEEEL